jgi:hypothetical protein
MEHLHLRLATDHTPQPYFHPILRFVDFTRLRSLILIQIDREDILTSIGKVLALPPTLMELRIWADADAQLSLSTMFAELPAPGKLSLILLDLRGFADLNSFDRPLWTVVSPTVITHLTLEIGSPFLHEEYIEFWTSASFAHVQLTHLSTNIVSSGLVDFISSFNGLSSLVILPSNQSNPVDHLQFSLKVLAAAHSETLRVLDLHPQGIDERAYLMLNEDLKAVAMTCVGLTEFAFGIQEDELVS